MDLIGPSGNLIAMKQGRLFSTESSFVSNAPLVINEIACKTIISKSGLYDIDFSINPYKGCQHRCSYCYARSMVERWGERRQWGQYVDVKANAPEILQKQLKRANTGSILVSSVTDPYQPIEADFRLTRHLLSRLSGTKFQIIILTKSALVSRDIDIFRKNSHWEIGMTLTTGDDALRTVIEPQASSVEERLGALRALANAGVKTYAFLGPLLPFISDTTLSELLDAIADTSISYVMVDRLNLRGSTAKWLAPVVQEILPNRTEEFFNACRRGSTYFAKLKKTIANECAIRGLQIHFCY